MEKHVKIKYNKPRCNCENIKGKKIPLENFIKNENILSFNISGLDCPNCAMKLEEKINKLNFIKNINIVFTTNTIYVEPNINITPAKLLLLIQKEIDKIEPGVIISEAGKIKENINKNNSIIKNYILHIIGFLTFIITNLFLNNIILLHFISYVLIGYKILYKAAKNILNKNLFDENFLMSIATIGALLIGEYFEANAVLIFYLIGEYLQQKASNKAKCEIESLIDKKEEYTNKKEKNKLIKIKAKDVQINDILLIKTGEIFPVDGTIVEGESRINKMSLTGESTPVKINVDSKILAGSINMDSPVEMIATKTYEDSAIAKIIDSIKTAAAKKTKAEYFVTKFSKIYTPLVCVVSLIVLIIYSFIFSDIYTGAYKALTFLVISCPCALVISIPLSVYIGIGSLGKIGVLIKGGNYLEKLKDIKIIAFDKTGTLTKGEFNIKHKHPTDPDTIKLITHTEYLSNHPIAKSILKSYKDIIIDKNIIKNFKEHKGLGVEATIGKDHVAIGNMDFLATFGVVVPIEDMYDNVFIIKNNSYIGSITLSDEIKNTAYSAVDELFKININPVILTGDNKKQANEIGSMLGIKENHASLLPWQKVEKIEELLKNKPTAFVGDGMNDAPVLKRADIGIAIGDIGSDIAISAADIVLLKNDLTLIPKSIKISKKVNKIIKENIIFTLLIKLTILLLALFGYAPMLLGIFADVGVTILAILNTFRIRKLDE